VALRRAAVSRCRTLKFAAAKCGAARHTAGRPTWQSHEPRLNSERECRHGMTGCREAEWIYHNGMTGGLYQRGGCCRMKKVALVVMADTTVGA